jgi:hypothetical protein
MMSNYNIFYNRHTYKQYHYVKCDGNDVYLVEDGCKNVIQIAIVEFLTCYTNSINEIRKIKIEKILK